MLVGLFIAFGELAVGLGTLFGLLGRIAAAGGMALSLILFLSVSFNTTPYFYGSDIVFFFAWTPLVLGGSGALSVDAALRHVTLGTSHGRCVQCPSAPDLDRRAAVRKLASAVTSRASLSSPPASRQHSGGCSALRSGPRAHPNSHRRALNRRALNRRAPVPRRAPP